jgi:hypothetical protein
MRGLDEWNGEEGKEVRAGCYYSAMALAKNVQMPTMTMHLRLP